MTPDTALEAITQADREAAADLLLAIDMVANSGADWTRAGHRDHGPTVQAFARHRRLNSHSAGEGLREADRIAEMIDEGGAWRACSGCQEGEDGHVSARDYPYSAVYRCQPGGGCTECGGIGVIWEPPGFWDGYGENAPSPDASPDSGVYPTEQMLAAGLRECRVSTHADKGVVLDVWNAMWGARPSPSPAIVKGLVARLLGHADYDEDMSDALRKSLREAAATLSPAIVKEAGEVERAMKLADIADRIRRQAVCLEGYAVQAGHAAKPVPSVFHLQASHFADLADELASAALSASNAAQVSK